MKTDSQLIQEVADRVTRIESRVVQLGDHVGANLRTKQRIEIVPNVYGDPPYIEVDALDVSLSRILAELRQNASAFALYPIDIRHKGQRIATLLAPRDPS